MNSILNISAYKFVELDDTPALQRELKKRANQLHLKGTILLASEGINLFIAGSEPDVRKFLEQLQADVRFDLLPLKESWSESQPFTRMLVRLKKEIIAFGVDEIQPAKRPGKMISAATLKQWLDEGRDFTLLDTRNTYEIELGTFDKALGLPIQNFREFPHQAQQLDQKLKQKPVVMFCTGGIRCEKAGPYLSQAGYDEVYQLDGGILRYFEDCGSAHYHGDCFVFDDRVAVKSDLAPSGAMLCYACQSVLNAEQIASPKYRPPHYCPHCYKSDEEQKRLAIADKQAKINMLSNDLPGCSTYTNTRPIHIPKRLAGQSLLACLLDLFPQCNLGYWQHEFEQNFLQNHDLQGQVSSPDDVVKEGQRIDHIDPNYIEPEVNAGIKIIDQDDMLLVISKPAGLPSHASGRFCRNTLEYLIRQLYLPEKIRLVHRLDANTSGLMILARRFTASKSLQKQFAQSNVEKTYIARIHGHPTEQIFECNAPIARECGPGGTRNIDLQHGLTASTHFELVQSFDDGTSLVYAYPKTGRTNQIRCHLWHLGFPIVNDPAYLQAGKLGENRMLAIAQPPLCLHALKIEIEHPVTGRRIGWIDDKPSWAY